jgi:hypothetical protein
MDFDAPAGDAESPVGCVGNVFGSGEFRADRLDDGVGCVPGCAVDLDVLAGVVFGGSADFSNGCRALPFTARELS